MRVGSSLGQNILWARSPLPVIRDLHRFAELIHSTACATRGSCCRVYRSLQRSSGAKATGSLSLGSLEDQVLESLEESGKLAPGRHLGHRAKGNAPGSGPRYQILSPDFYDVLAVNPMCVRISRALRTFAQDVCTLIGFVARE